LNILTNCEITLLPDMTKEDTIIKALTKFGIDTNKASLYTLSLWIEHKENKEIEKKVLLKLGNNIIILQILSFIYIVKEKYNLQENMLN